MVLGPQPLAERGMGRGGGDVSDVNRVRSRHAPLQKRRIAIGGVFR